MDNSDCKKISSLIELYVEGKLNIHDRMSVEQHLADCPFCRDKYVRMKDTIKNLRSSYEHLLEEFEKIEQDNVFKIKEHEIFYANISSYIDNELSYDDSVNFRKYLLKSKTARRKLEEAYSLENSLKTTFSEYCDNLRINYAKKITERIKTERKEPIGMMLKRMMIALGVLTIFMIAFFLYITTAYNKQVSDNVPEQTQELVPSTGEEQWEEEPLAPESEMTTEEENTSETDTLAEAEVSEQ